MKKGNIFVSFLKFVFFFGLLGTGVYFAAQKVPYLQSLKASLYEAINPTIKEDHLIQKLSTNLDTLNRMQAQSAVSSAVAKTSVPDPKTKQLIQDSQKLLQNIKAINQSHSSLPQQVLGNIVNVVTNAVSSKTSTSASSTPQPTIAPCTASN